MKINDRQSKIVRLRDRKSNAVKQQNAFSRRIVMLN